LLDTTRPLNAGAWTGATARCCSRSCIAGDASRTAGAAGHRRAATATTQADNMKICNTRSNVRRSWW
jgi:hypothetical protein